MASEAAAMQEAFFGTSPSVILDDAYRLREDYIADGVDALERRAHALAEEMAARKARLAALSRGDGGAGSAKGNQKGAAEVGRGMDSLLAAMVEALELSGDMFDLFALRNAFRWPTGLQYDLPAATGDGQSALSNRVYTADEETAVDGRIAALEAAFKAECMRRRALAGLASLLSKRVPQAEEAALELEAVAASLDASGSTAAAEGGVGAALASSGQLRALLGRLSDAVSAGGGGEGAGMDLA